MLKVGLRQQFIILLLEGLDSLICLKKKCSDRQVELEQAKSFKQHIRDKIFSCEPLT